jgi:hypothetical protein
VQRGHRLANVPEKQGKRSVESSMAGNHDIVAGAELRVLRFRRKSGLQPSANAVPRNGVSYFLCNREAEARPSLTAGRCARPFSHFDQKCRRRRAPAAAYSEKFGTRLERWQDRNDSLQSREKRQRGLGARP